MDQGKKWRAEWFHVALFVLFCSTVASSGLALRYRRLARQRPEPAELVVPPAVETVVVRTPAAPADLEQATRQAARREAELVAQIEALRTALAELEAENARREERARTRPTTTERRGPEAGGPQAGVANFMETLRERDPQRYEEMQNRMRDFMTRTTENLDRQTKFLGALDVAAMTPEQAEGHKRFLELAGENQRLMETIAMDPNAEGVRDLRRQLFENSRELRELGDAERELALGDFARQIGYKGTEVDEFVAYVNSVVELTSPGGGFGGGPGRGRDEAGGGQPRQRGDGATGRGTTRP